MSTQHTPGPWTYHPDDTGDSCAAIVGKTGWVCDFINHPSDANARLMAAAPDLLDALWAMYTSFAAVEWMELHMQQASNMARAAIEKAIGRPA